MSDDQTFHGAGRYESIFVGFRNRLFQTLARGLPGATSIRVWLHRRRGAKIGRNVFIGTDVIIDTSLPHKVWIGDNTTVGMRSTLVGHFGNIGRAHIRARKPSLIIEDDVFIGPGCVIMPNTRIGKGAVVAAGSVVTRSIRPGMMVQGNPAVPIARCGVPLLRSTPIWEFYRNLESLPTKS